MNAYLHEQVAKARVQELAREAVQRRPISNPHARRPTIPATLVRAAYGPRQLRARPAFALVAGIVGLSLFASATPSPLYADYAARWHFSTPMLTSCRLARRRDGEHRRLDPR
jgi:hypothetical protein